VTTIIEMPYDQGRPVIARDVFLAKRERLEAECVVDCALLATIKKTGGLDQIAPLAEAGACGFKLSLFETDPNRFPRIPDPELLAAFRLVRETGLPVGLHCENDELVTAFTQEAQASGAEAIAHCRSRPGIVETSAILKALEFAQETGVRLHICHASLSRSVRLVSWYRGLGARATVETCTHYLCLSEGDMARLGARGKINPPLRAAAERDSLWPLCADGSVDLIASDHAPWQSEFKNQPNIFDNASGAPGVEALATMIFSEGVAKGRLTIHDYVRLPAERPASLFGLAHRKGQIRVGADADFTILDPRARWTLDESGQCSTAGWSPYHGWKLQGRVTTTVVRGRVVYNGREVVAHPGTGQFVAGKHHA
jgi:allantoinase